MTQERARELMKTQKEAYMYNIRKMIDELDPEQDAQCIIGIYTILRTWNDNHVGRNRK